MEQAPVPMPLGERHHSEPKREPDAGVQASSAIAACFDCNICLDFAAEPVVTLCGHLYCWPCIYKWLQQADSAAAPRQCPVCKAALPQDALVPLYGGGGGGVAKKPRPCPHIPRRPAPPRRDAIEHPSPGPNEAQLPPEIRTHRRRYPDPGWDHTSPSPRAIHSTAVAVLLWVFRDQEWASVYYSSPHYMGGNSNGGSSRQRRQEMELERSLHQISVFFLCCAILCLLLF